MTYEWQVRCSVCNKTTEPSGRGTVIINHDMKIHREYDASQNRKVTPERRTR